MENGTGMLHVAVLAHNTEAIQYLTSTKISPKLRDKSGFTADQVCFSSAIRRTLPPRYLHRESRHAADGRMVLKPSLQDKDTIFKLAANPKYFDEIQKKLQTLDFNVNTECDTNGDFLLHIVCKKGLSQLPLMMALVKIQGADVELCNAEGHTPLMLAAATGNCVLCDVLMCLFGADPNKPNPNTGRCALHYAVEGNHSKTVECLLRRGADVNVEDLHGRRPDDIPLCQGTNDDCHEVIKFNRTRRIEALSERIRKGELEVHHLLPTDMCVVDDEGYTLIMMAAIYNRADVLKTLLQTNAKTIDAQHIKTGMTALAIAAQMGNVEAVDLLLSHGANPTIQDMKDYLPLHHAVLNNQEKVVDAMLEDHYFPQCYTGLFTATRLCKKTSIHTKLKKAFTRRQDQVVTPKLLACALNGSADELYQLLDEGDNINLKSGTGNWPLYLAVQNGHLDIVKLLFERGGDIRKRHSTTGETVLHIAAKMGHLEIIQYLLNFCHSAHVLSSRHLSRKLMDINTTDSNNRTPLQVAAEKGFSKIVETLLQHGATTALLDASGQLITCPQFEGVRVQIEAHRQQHTKDVASCITDRSKKAFEQLQEIWLPRFDHNLRTKQGDTPLMVACATGKLQILKFFLESAVYQKTRVESDGIDDSDADSVLDPVDKTFLKCPGKISDGEDLQNSEILTQSSEVQTGQLSEDFERSLDIIKENEIKETDTRPPTATTQIPQRSLEVLLHDVSRPKGLYIFHDGLISHVCAVSQQDGSTALHRTVEHGDNYQMVKVLLAADPSCVNIQNNAGLSALHLACKLGRKKIIEQLVGAEGIDLNVQTLDNLLPEEMTTSKSVIKMVQKARFQQTGLASPPPKPQDIEVKDDASFNAASVLGSASFLCSTVNFDKVHSQYEALRKENKNGS